MVAAIVALATWLRLPQLTHGYAPDEFANLWHGGLEAAWAITVDPESGVNPPLLRLLFNVPFAEPTTLWLGRRFTLLCGLIAVALAYALGVRASGGSRVAGALAALLVAVDPEAVKMSARFRSYAPFAATLAWHLLALTDWMSAVREGPPDAAQRRRTAVVVSAALLPWWHYLAIPLLLVLGAMLLLWPPYRRGVALYVPAGLLVAPMGLLILGSTGARVAHGTPLITVYERLLSLRLQTHRAVTRQVIDRLPDGLADDPATVLPAVLVALVLVATPLLWRRLPDPARVLWVATAAILVTVAIFAQVQLVRTPTVVMLLVPVAPLLFGAWWALPTRWLPPLLATGLGAVLLSGTPEQLPREASSDPYGGLPAFAASWHDHDADRGDGPVVTWPAYTYVGAYFYLTGRHVRYMDGYGPSGCAPDEDGCFAVDGVRWLAVREGSTEAPDEGLVAAFGRPPDGFAAGCRPLRDERWVRVWACGDHDTDVADPSPPAPSPADPAP